ncbi:MAG: hypothetical protein L0Z55_08630 [Planctomycetes bacterium]|nr:hypothetical protein [Planctomycetota bacterium]
MLRWAMIFACALPLPLSQAIAGRCAAQGPEPPPPKPTFFYHELKQRHAIYLVQLKMDSYGESGHPDARFRDRLISLGSREMLSVVVDGIRPEMTNDDLAFRREYRMPRGLVRGMPTDIATDFFVAAVEEARAKDIPIYFLIGQNNFEIVTTFMGAVFGAGALNVVLETRLAPIDPLAGELELGGYIPPIATNRLVIVGAYHNDPDGRPIESFARMHRYLSARARRREIVLGIEGDILDRARLAAVRKDESWQSASCEFGIDDAIPFLYSFTLLAYWNLLGDPSNYEMTTRVQLVAAVATSVVDRPTWESLAERALPPEAETLHQEITKFALGMRQGQVESVRERRIAELTQTLASRDAWRLLFKELFLATEEQLPGSEARIVPDLPTIHCYLDHPQDRGAWQYLFDEVNIRWRDSFIARNIRDLVDTAAQKQLPVYVLIGEGHLLDLLQRLGPEVSGYQVVPFKGLSDLPAEYFPGFQLTEAMTAPNDASTPGQSATPETSGEAPAVVFWVAAGTAVLAALLFAARASRKRSRAKGA